jgi:hypothetical protein
VTNQQLDSTISGIIKALFIMPLISKTMKDQLPLTSRESLELM